MVAVTDSTFEFRISRLAYIAVLIVALLVVVMMGASMWFGFLAVLIAVVVWLIERPRTTVDADGVTARGLFSTDVLAWDDIHGLRFPKWSAVRAVTTDDRAVRLPAVGFVDIPKLSAASGGRLPDPFAAEREARLASD